MAKRTSEEWLRSLGPGDTISVTFPGDSSPSTGRVTELFEEFMYGTFGERGREQFISGSLAGHPDAKLQPVSTGAGGSVGQPMNLSNIFGERAAE